MPPRNAVGMQGEKLIRGEPPRNCFDTEKALFRSVQSDCIDRIHLIVREQVHPVITDAEQEKRRESHDQTPCGRGHEEERSDKYGKHKVLATETYVECRHAKPQGERGDTDHRLGALWQFAGMSSCG